MSEGRRLACCRVIMCSAPSPLGYIAVVVVDDAIAGRVVRHRSCRAARTGRATSGSRRTACLMASAGATLRAESSPTTRWPDSCAMRGGERVDLNDLPVTLDD